MSETKKSATNFENLKTLSYSVQSGDLTGISKRAKELKHSCGELLLEAKKLAEKITGSNDVQVKEVETVNEETSKEVIVNKETVETIKVEQKNKAEKEAKTETKVDVKVQKKKKSDSTVEISEKQKEAIKSVEKKVTEEKPVTSGKQPEILEVKEEAKEEPTPEKKEKSQAELDAIARAIERDRRWKQNSETAKQKEGGVRRFDNRQNNNGNRPYGQGGQNQGQRPYQPRQNNGTYQPRQNNGFGDKDQDTSKRPLPKKPMGGKTSATTAFVPNQPTKNFGNKKKDKTSEVDNKKTMNKRTLIRKGFIIGEDDEFDDRMGSKKIRPRKSKDTAEVIKAAPIKIEKAVVSTDIIPIKTLSEKIGVTATDITKKLFNEGQLKTINDSIDFEMAEYIAIGYGVTLEYQPLVTAEEELTKDHLDEDEANLKPRPPIVTVMGHVDHGKTSLLDAIKHSQVTLSEAGGITQHIGAYSVEIKGRKITFIDTPGHEAFTSMRKRGAQITDIAVLVVAADDGVMPQTVEAINHIKAAGVEMVVAINKMDKPNANKDRIMQQLVDYEVLSEEWGGTTIMVPVSAKTGEGINNLLESILTVADLLELKANPDRKASGVVIEAQLDKGKGPVATVLVQNGTLRVGDTIISGFVTGRIRAMTDDKGRKVVAAGPSMAVSIQGLSDVPEAGEKIMAVDDKLSKAVLEERQKKQREDMNKQQAAVSLEEIAKRLKEGQIKGLNLIIKADVQGSVEAVKQALLKLSNEEVTVKVIHGAVGAINESDVMLASTSSAIIIGFNVRPDAKTKAMAERDNVEIKTYRIIYDAIDDISAALKGMLAPKFKEVFLGSIEVRDVFKITDVGTIAGGYVIEGKILRNSKAKLLRQGIIVHEGNISSLKRFKDDVKEVAQGFECGIGLENYNDIKPGDVIEVSVMEEVER